MSSEFEILVHDTFVGQCVSIAALTLLFYDHLITFADEVHLIWPAKASSLGWSKLFSLSTDTSDPSGSLFNLPASLVSPLFFLLRCRGWITANTYIEMLNIQMLSFIIVTRVYDIWQSQKLAFFVLAPFWLIHFILDIFIVTDHTVKSYAGYGYLQIANVCTANPGNLWVLLLNGIIYHVLILLLLMWIWLSIPRTAQTPFVRLVIRDGFIYFITIIAAMLFNLLAWRYARPSLVLLPYNLVWVVLNVSLSRTLLSLGSVQTSEEWGQRANLTIIPADIELGRVLSWGTISTYAPKHEDDETSNSVRRTSRVVKLII
ncbi:unnamed protein product [Rhizoctonia solani]|uniref:DUF6533 domain-containing protein n=1 Tax=Rhizoctonia solani TaxID=456999 RepID=A0A8H3CJ32_9AGAM|nr:unnamed protein product [Rhizoctonia solani]